MDRRKHLIDGIIRALDGASYSTLVFVYNYLNA